MKEDMTRRDFLRVGLAAAGIAGASALTRSAWAQEQEHEKEKPEEKDEKKDEKDKEKKDENYDDLFEKGDSSEEETRACPQCGALMYRQGRTWTCENCGYSYVE